MTDYKNTLKLPQTNFPIKSNANREIELVKKWEEEKLYDKIQNDGGGKRKFTLHDGPPYANGHIHHGHILNKILKDIVVKSKNMQGYQAELIPGWDCHGLPIEVEVDKELGPKRSAMDKASLRKKYREYAEGFVNIQRREFKRLGILADWDNPYVTMSSKYEAQTLRELAKIARAGLLYKDLKPVFWCPTLRTALADTEVEHKEHISPSIYFMYKLVAGPNDYLAVWTTTPWTLPANQAVACNFEAEYVRYEIATGKWIWVAEQRLNHLLEKLNIKFNEDKVSIKSKGSKFCGEPYYGHYHRGGLVYHSDHVRMDTGTGFVHIAPAHGLDDFQMGKKHHLQVISSIGNDGKTVDGLGIAKGLTLEEANQTVIDYLWEQDLLLKGETLEHKYPYSIRSGKPVIMRATDQWFINVDKSFNNGPSLRERALMAIQSVKWIPEQGVNRIESMLNSRPDWCISRQRTWGVPIVSFTCDKCSTTNLNPDVMDRIADEFEKHNSDVWTSIKDTFGLKCDNFGCDSASFTKNEDIVDVWFDSGVSNAAVYGEQVDLYLEGSDQHRGWFQSTLLASLGANERTPYRQVLTHGFVVDENGEKLSKSKKNYVDPFKYIEKEGAEVLRLWVASSEYRNDIRVAPVILDVIKQAHHKIRNTVRYLIANLNGYKESADVISQDLDKYMLSIWSKIYNECIEAYNAYDFHRVVKAVESFCVNDLSAFYLDVNKDVIYCDGVNSINRRSAQKTMFLIAKSLIALMAPIMSFTMEDAWHYLGMQGSVHQFKELSKMEFLYPEVETKINKVRKLKELVNAKLEQMRAAKEIGSSSEAIARIQLNPDYFGGSYPTWDEFETIFNVSNAYVYSWVDPDPLNIRIEVSKSKYNKCARCWKHKHTVGLEKNKDLCKRCDMVINSICD